LRIAGEPSITNVPRPIATAAVRKRAAVPALPISRVASDAANRPSTPSTVNACEIWSAWPRALRA